MGCYPNSLKRPLARPGLRLNLELMPPDCEEAGVRRFICAISRLTRVISGRQKWCFVTATDIFPDFCRRRVPVLRAGMGRWLQGRCAEDHRHGGWGSHDGQCL